MNIGKIDLLRIGVFLIGISMLIISIILLQWHIRAMTNYWEPPKLDAWGDSSNNVIIITARDTLTNVVVKDKNGTVLCKFDKINKGSQEICPVSCPGIFTVESDGIKRVVTCYKIEKVKVNEVTKD